uniref:Robl_LC7 domain-containing protein n=1 Tax=Steinernema glaseri TaxID=37863 RepID=A0A1I7YA89_9BILA
MLKPKVLTNVLHEVNTDQVTCAMLFNKEGSLLAYSGVNDGKSTADVNAALISNIWDTFERQEGSLLAYSGVNDGKSTADVNAALISNIWDTFERQGKDDLVHTMIQCENGNIAVTSVSGMLLALKANSSVPLGMLKAKLIALTTYLEPHLLTVAKDSKF